MTQSESTSTKIKPYSKFSSFLSEVEYRWLRFFDVVIRTPWYWFRCHFVPSYRFHIIDLRKGGNGYSWGWYDTDSRMLHACFTLLKEYVELEKPFEHVIWHDDEEHDHAGKEIKDLYNWWMVRRPEARQKLAFDWENEPYDTRLIKLPDGGYKVYQSEKIKTLVQREEELNDEDQRNLERLVKIRGFLWT